ncbi:MAG: hypothetical protein OEZ43_19160 [Gammaproteobacteria bacterium]|nr:hypothetical protein [Gammaproteobacteria bacterium]
MQTSVGLAVALRTMKITCGDNLTLLAKGVSVGLTFFSGATAPTDELMKRLEKTAEEAARELKYWRVETRAYHTRQLRYNDLKFFGKLNDS